MSKHETSLEMRRSILALSMGYGDSFLSEVVSGWKSELLLGLVRLMEDSGALGACSTAGYDSFQLCVLRKVNVFSFEVSNDSASLQWRITVPVVESICIVWRFLPQKQKGKEEKEGALVHFPVKEEWALSRVYVRQVGSGQISYCTDLWKLFQTMDCDKAVIVPSADILLENKMTCVGCPHTC